MSASSGIKILDVTDEQAFGLLPPCADPRFDHRSCDYWEDEVNGAKAARPSWWRSAEPQPTRPRPVVSGNPFAPSTGSADEFNPFAPEAVAAALDPLGGDDLFATPAFNPFAPTPKTSAEPDSTRPRKVRLLSRGIEVFGSYAKVLVLDAEPAAYTQFGPLSAYPRAQQIRALYPRLPQSPLPAVITCIAIVPAARGRGLGRLLVDAVCDDLGKRGFAAVETYPDLTLGADEASAAHPDFWLTCGFALAAADERYPVMRRELT